jgi:hypothetical protein
MSSSEAKAAAKEAAKAAKAGTNTSKNDGTLSPSTPDDIQTKPSLIGKDESKNSDSVEDKYNISLRAPLPQLLLEGTDYVSRNKFIESYKKIKRDSDLRLLTAPFMYSKTLYDLL